MSASSVVLESLHKVLHAELEQATASLADDIGSSSWLDDIVVLDVALQSSQERHLSKHVSSADLSDFHAVNVGGSSSIVDEELKPE